MPGTGFPVAPVPRDAVMVGYWFVCIGLLMVLVGVIGFLTPED